MADLGVPELKTELKKIQLAHPNWRNPYNEDLGFCAYDMPNGCHCMIGQLAFEMGWKVPPPNYEEDASAAAEMFKWPVTLEGMAYLKAVQLDADGSTSQVPERKWSEVNLEVAPWQS